MGEDSTPVAGSLLSFLGVAERARLLEQGVRRSFAADELLHREGDPTTHVLILTAGWVRVSASVRDGQVVLLALRGPGDVLGELAALNGWTRSATVRTVEPVELVQLTGEQFVSCLLTEPTVAVSMMRNLSVRLRDAEAARIDLATLDVSRRVATYLHRLAVDHGVRTADGVLISVPLTQQDVANRVGASRRAVARTLLVLRERGVVSTARRRIVVARPGVLRMLAGVHES